MLACSAAAGVDRSTKVVFRPVYSVLRTMVPATCVPWLSVCR